MSDLLSITWYMDEPIDFEHKEYLLYGYLQKVDKSFLDKKLSPHLLHLERMTDELHVFSSSFTMIRKDFDKNRYIYFDNRKLIGEDDKIIYEIKEIVEFSIPQIKSRIDFGYKVLNKNRQILF